MTSAVLEARIRFFRSGAQIETSNLSMHSVKKQDIPFYQSLFGNKEVMTRFGDGKVRASGAIATRVNEWIQRWEHGNLFSALAVFKKESDEREVPMGHIVLGYGRESGEAELTYLLEPNSYEYEGEMVGAVVKDYAKELVKNGCSLYGESLKTIITAVRVDNAASSAILKGLGMKYSRGVDPLYYTMQVV